MEIKDVSVDGFKEFLQFFYLNEVKITIENIADVMYLAEKYDVAGCMRFCEQFLLKQHLTGSDILSAFELSIKFERSELKGFLKKQIREDPLIVFSSDKFKICTKETMKHILKIKCLNCEPNEVFEGCMKWAEESCRINSKDPSVENQRIELDDCFHLMPFDLMDPTEISECATQYIGLFTCEELEDIIKMLKMDGSSQLRKFKPKTHFTKWNKKAVLKCSRSGSSTSQIHYVNQLEVASFRVNRKMLFGAISLDGLCLNPKYCKNETLFLTGVLTVTEKVTDQHTNVLLTQPVALRVNEKPAVIKFNKYLITRFDKLYEVQVLFDASLVDHKFLVDVPPYLSEVTFGENQKVNFLRNSCIRYDNLNRGIISQLHFNSINNSTETWNHSWNKYLIIAGSIVIGLILLRTSAAKRI